MEVQRVEEARGRKNDEIDRRNLQMRTQRNQLMAVQRKIIARDLSKNYLKTFKRDTLQYMVDIGTLRRPVDLSIGNIFLP